MRLVTILVIVSAALAAEEPVANTIKLLTWGPEPYAVGSYGVEAGLGLARSSRAFDDQGDRSDRGGDARTIGGYLLLATGLAEHLDLSLVLPAAHLKDEADGRDAGGGLGDPTVRATWKLADQQDAGISLAVLPALTLPWGKQPTDRELAPGSGYSQGELAIALARTDGQLVLQADAAMARYVGDDRGDTLGHYYADLAAGWQLSEMIQIEAELNWFAVRSGGEDPYTLAVTGGVVATPNDDWTLLGGITRTVAGRSADLTTTFSAIAIRAF